MKSKAKEVYKKVRDHLDNQVGELSPQEYLDFLDIFLSDLESRQETTRSEIEDSEK